ncbi:MAG: hypothetical protein VCE12_17830, partial [Candidatus Latescibacterota bacterium]
PDWKCVTEAAPWQPRDSQGELVYDDHMWILGGWFTPTDTQSAGCVEVAGRQELNAHGGGRSLGARRSARDDGFRRQNVADGRTKAP